MRRKQVTVTSAGKHATLAKRGRKVPSAAQRGKTVRKSRLVMDLTDITLSRLFDPDRSIYYKKTSKRYMNNIYCEDKVIKKKKQNILILKQESVFATEN